MYGVNGGENGAYKVFFYYSLTRFYLLGGPGLRVDSGWVCGLDW